MARSKTVIANPPGVTIKEQLVDRGMTQKEFAARMDMSEKHISHLINGDVQLTLDVARRLESVLGLPAKFWINLETIYREKLIKVQDENEMAEDMEIAQKFPYAEMARNNWVSATHKAEEKVVELRKFFEVVKLSLLKNNLVPNIAYRRQSITEKSNYALIAWAQKAKLEAREIETEPINIKKLENILPEIRHMTVQDPQIFLQRLSVLLSDCGIAVILLPHFNGSFLHGMTFNDRNKIVLGLTTRGKDADKFWFSLFHELGHIILGHINQVDGTNENDEKEADKFARDTLIPLNEWSQFISNHIFDESSIMAFADQEQIDTGIIVGRLQKEGYIDYSQYHDLKTEYDIA